MSISVRAHHRLMQTLPRLWIVRVQPDGKVGYRTVEASGRATATVPIASVEAASAGALDALRTELAGALTGEGLFADEARAMLETWRLSYFESEGLRVFFVLPPAWTDSHLPLSISAPASITRVMLGRVEIVSPHQREVLQQLHELPESAFDLKPPYYDNVAVQKRLNDGKTSHADFYRIAGREVPPALKLYDSLGRFRDALLAHEWRSATNQAQRQRLEFVMARFSSCQTQQAPAQDPTNKAAR